MTAVEIVSAGDSTLLVRFEARIDAAINDRAIALAAAVEAAAIPGIRDVVPTYRSVAVFFDPLRTDIRSLRATLDRELQRAAGVDTSSSDPIRVPVCYGGSFGPDLAAAATMAGMLPEDFVAIHASVVYRVFMLGFLPGFAYMGAVDERIAVPRRPTPRTRVPKGSVGIAGQQTGIYPVSAPGGWQLIGRTPLDPFDPQRASPFLFKAGDRVRFVPMDHDEWKQ